MVLLYAGVPAAAARTHNVTDEFGAGGTRVSGLAAHRTCTYVMDAKEREAAKAWREGRAGDQETEEVGGVAINVDEKFKHMQIGKTASSASLGGGSSKGEAPKVGMADDAFGSDSDEDDW